MNNANRACGERWRGWHLESCPLNSCPRVATAFLALLLATAAAPHAQGPAECATSECAAAGLQGHPPPARLWAEAAAIHQLKLEFVDGLQRFTRAQAGTFERAELSPEWGLRDAWTGVVPSVPR